MRSGAGGSPLSSAAGAAPAVPEGLGTPRGPSSPPGPPQKRFPAAAVEAVLKAELEGCLRELRYEPGLCREMAAGISEVIRARVKELLVPRYKIVVVTHIGQLNGQGVQVGGRCLWDPATDTFSSYVFKNNSLFAVANVYAVYFE
ncbi:UNVERIFIED_CONTAM: hypothetical protein H355_009045 [Colinus virginianus]|nr:hypothetical protein H355_009045 [Colinus virginianus]